MDESSLCCIKATYNNYLLLILFLFARCIICISLLNCNNHVCGKCHLLLLHVRQLASKRLRNLPQEAKSPTLRTTAPNGAQWLRARCCHLFFICTQGELTLLIV